MDVLLDGVAISGYRSFGATLERIGPLQQVSLFAGPNNSGKSNILRFVHRWLPTLVRGQSDGTGTPLEPLDRHRPSEPPLRFAIATALDGSHSDSLRDKVGSNAAAKKAVDTVLQALSAEDGLIWWPFIADSTGSSLDSAALFERIDTAGLRQAFSQLGSTVSNLSPQNRLESFLREVGGWLDRNRPSVAPVVIVPAVRQIGVSTPDVGDELTGADLIERLAELQNPSITEYDHGRKQFDAINEFVQAVTEDPNAQLQVPNARDTIHVRLGSSMMPLENLGSGIHEVTMLAAWSTVFERHIVCLEEPEIHLHPLLQRKLLNYLHTRTTNQYLIATHSAHFLDRKHASVFHVRWNGGETTVSAAITPAQRVELCADLGYKASDLLQTNAVIWVEGPSDRIYIRHWISAVDPELVEGVHYSLMFYGGRLLSHLSADDNEVTDFISLRQINQYLAIVIDSDKSGPRAKLNETKQRVCGEFDKGPGFAWVTTGREIENYLPRDLLWQSIVESHPQAVRDPEFVHGRYVDVTKVRLRRKTVTMDKVKVAHRVTEHAADLGDC